MHPLKSAIFHSLQMAEEDVVRWTQDLSLRQLWLSPGGAAPIGFHIRHIARSLDRMLTYAEGHALSDLQLNLLRLELEPGASLEDLLAEFRAALAETRRRVETIDTGDLSARREVGRARLPTTLLGLLLHLCEHTQRHTGQVVSLARVTRAWPESC